LWFLQELYKTTEELEVKKADKQMVESEIVSFRPRVDRNSQMKRRENRIIEWKQRLLYKSDKCAVRTEP